MDYVERARRIAEIDPERARVRIAHLKGAVWRERRRAYRKYRETGEVEWRRRYNELGHVIARIHSIYSMLEVMS